MKILVTVLSLDKCFAMIDLLSLSKSKNGIIPNEGVWYMTFNIYIIYKSQVKPFSRGVLNHFRGGLYTEKMVVTIFLMSSHGEKIIEN